jgi:hypothetical protein
MPYGIVEEEHARGLLASFEDARVLSLFEVSNLTENGMEYG